MTLIKRIFAWVAALTFACAVTACGGGGGKTSAPTPTPASTPALKNFAAITVDAGPAVLATGANPYIADNVAFVSVTLCAPGTSNCQTIDHVQVDTGSVGLRIFQSVLTPSLLQALPNQTDASANPVGECFGFVDSYAFGSVRSADFQVGGETVANMPLQVIADTGVFATAPSQCSSGGGTALTTVSSLGANGILGIGVSATDCGAFCTTAGGSAAATYYDCPSSGCSSIIARMASTTAPFQQLPNPVAAMAVDNNGTIISLPAISTPTAVSTSGTLYFGIGTQTNNALGSAKILATTTSTGPDGSGLITVTSNGQTYDEGFLDSGSNLFLFPDDALAQCTDSNFVGYYCPPSATTVDATVEGLSGAAIEASCTVENAQTQLSTQGDSVILGVSGSPGLFDDLGSVPQLFDFGLPFFYGRDVYTAIEGRVAGTSTGPYYAY